MANRFFNPDPAFFTSSGAALSGAQLFFYATGTSTKQNTYSDSALSIANSNPVVLDSNGRCGSIFLQNLKYKVVFAPSTDTDPPTSPIWTMDPVYASDVSTVAQVTSTNGNPNGQLAGTQGSASVPASMAWDFTNDILYVCTTTGTSVTAVWTAVNPTGTAQPVPQPTGRLTLVSVTPVMSTDQTGATSVLYTPYTGNTVPIYNGTTFISNTYSELTLTLASQHAADTLYDVFIFLNSGVVTLATGPAWNNSTAGSCARGTGASTTQLSRINGILVNTVSMTGRNGASTFTIGANLATYLGTIYIDHTAGQVTCHFSFGQNRKFGIWNAYNRVPVILQAGDSTASWSYSSGTVRASNNTPASWASTTFNVGSGTSANGITVLTGLAEEEIASSFQQQVNAGGSGTVQIGVGFNSTTAVSGLAIASTAISSKYALTSNYLSVPTLGIGTFVCCESGNGAAPSFTGTSTSMLLQTTYRG